VKSCQGLWFEALIEFAICKLCRRVYAKRTCALVTCDFHLVTTSTSTISFRFWPLHRSKRWMDARANRAILVILLITGIWNGSRKKSAPCTTIRFGRSPAVAPTFPTYKTTIESVLILFLTVRYTFFCHTIFTNLILFFKKKLLKIWDVHSFLDEKNLST
jgi:hypothetical protein